MSEEIIKVIGAAVICLALIIFLRKVSETYVPLVRTAAVLLFFGICIGMLSPLLGFAGDVLNSGGMGRSKTVLKALGISFLTGLCAEVCRSAGENGLASGVENIGKIEILLLSLPMLREVLSTAEEMLSW